MKDPTQRGVHFARLPVSLTVQCYSPEEKTFQKLYCCSSDPKIYLRKQDMLTKRHDPETSSFWFLQRIMLWVTSVETLSRVLWDDLFFLTITNHTGKQLPA